MKITDVEAFVLRAPNPSREAYWGKFAWAMGPASRYTPAFHEYPPRWRMRAVYSEHIEAVVVKVSTDEGVVGWGECKAPVAPEATREVVLRLLRPIVLGRDPRDVEVLWERMYAVMRLRGHVAGFLLEAIAGVDIALWDILGKWTGLPVSRLLGGRYVERVPVYASSVPGVRDPDDPDEVERVRAKAREFLDRGFRAMKMGIGSGLKADVLTVRTVREVVGPDVRLFVDAAGNYDVSGAITLGRHLEELGVEFLEAPLPLELADCYAQVAHALDIRVANDLIMTRYQTQDMLRRHALDVVQPDVCRSGGISECRRIAQVADVHGASIAPHVAVGTAIQFAATAHFASAIPNLLISEFWAGENPLGDAILKRPLVREGSYLVVPDGPGLGIEVDEDALLSHAV